VTRAGTRAPAQGPHARPRVEPCAPRKAVSGAAHPYVLGRPQAAPVEGDALPAKRELSQARLVHAPRPTPIPLLNARRCPRWPL
jgi:hypothetical protein